MEKKIDYKEDKDGNYTLKTTITTTPEDGFVH